MTPTPISATVWLAAASIVAVWPTAFAVIKIGLEHFSAEGLAVFRMLVAALAMLIYVAVRRYALPKGRDLLLLVVSGISGVGIYSYLLNLALETIPAGEAAFIVAINPVFVVLMSRIFLKEHFGIKTLAGMAIALAGVGLLTLENAHGISLQIGTLYALLAGFSFSLYLMLHKPLLERYPIDMMGAYCGVFGGLVFLPLLPSVWHEFRLDIPLSAHLGYVYLGLVCSAAGFLVWSYALRHLSRVQASTIVYLLPVSASLHAMWLVGEQLSMASWAGGALVLVGVVIVNVRRVARHRPPMTEPAD